MDPSLTIESLLEFLQEDTRDEILRQFDADNAFQHTCEECCECEPELFALESGLRRYRHKREC